MKIIYIETEELNAKKFIAVSTFQYVCVFNCTEALGIRCNSLRLFFSFLKKQISHPSSRLLKSLGGEGGGTPLYKPLGYVHPKGYGFCNAFCLKTGIDFAHFGLESSMVFKGAL